MARVEGVTSIVDAIAQDLRRQLFRGEIPSEEPLTEAGTTSVSMSSPKLRVSRSLRRALLVSRQVKR